MKLRIITAIIALCVLMPFIIFSDTFMLLIFSGVLSVVAIGEMFNCIGILKKLYITIPAMLVSTAAVLLTRLLPNDGNYLAVAFIVYFIFLLYTLTAAVFSRGKLDVTTAALGAMTTVYISFGFSSIVLLRDMPNGQYLFILAFLTPWMCDSFAYFTGMAIGKHKLIPDVSPKKTVEGAIGGIVFGTAAIVGYGALVGRYLITDLNARILPLIVVGIILCIISQCGDLIASLIKRHYGIKDYGKIFPGHGGVLDRFDSIIVTAPILYILFSISDFFHLFG
jgi:phosphatidate cytidylyltransferase